MKENKLKTQLSCSDRNALADVIKTTLDLCPDAGWTTIAEDFCFDNNISWSDAKDECERIAFWVIHEQ